MKKNIKSIVVLVCICACVSLLLAFTNAFTKPFIDANESDKVTGALADVKPEGDFFDSPTDLASLNLPKTVKEVFTFYKDSSKKELTGYVISISTTGYASGLNILCGIRADGTVITTKCISNSETPAIGGEAIESFSTAFDGKNMDEALAVDTVSGATITTTAYKNAIKDALNAATILGGGSAQLTPEEIYANNLSAALPSANGEFEKPFIAEVLDGIDAVHNATNNSGFVYVLGDKFIAVDTNGNVTTSCDEATANTVKAAIAKINATTTTDINLADYEGLPKQLLWAKRTATGNYIIQIKGAGYGINGGDDYHPASGEYIIIQLSMTKDGKIIDCYTVSQGETPNVGSVCENESFYGQFDGKTEENYREIDAISKATITTDGYLKAIERSFKAVKIFEGGQQ